MKRRTKFALLLPSLLATSCAIGHRDLPMMPATTKGGPVSYHDGIEGRARITIQVVDMRVNRAVQTLDQADDYQGLLFKLSNTTKLKATQVKAIAKGGSSTYNLVFDNLPVDATANYSLVAGLFRGLTDAASSADPGYSVLANKVGEGASANFSLTPGENKLISITINAVGAMSFTSSRFVLDEVSPVLTSGDSTLVMTVNDLTTANNPEALTLQTSVVDADGATKSVDVTDIGSTHATASVPVPTLGAGITTANFTIVADLLKGSHLLSRRTRSVTVSATASVNVDLDPTPASGGGE